ncbi:MAG: PAS domain S-box protein [Flavobacteriales bacterium]
MREWLKHIVEKADRFFIHPALRSNIEQYNRARALMYAMLATTFISTSYTIYHELSNSNIHPIKHVANVVAVLYCPLGLFFLKYKGKIKSTLLATLSMATTLVFASTYFCGGIYAVDLFWMIVISIVGILFIGNRGGFLLSAMALAYIFVFYFLEKYQFRDFAQDSFGLGVSYRLYNLFFLLGLASFITYFFVSNTEKAKRELDELKERQVKNLDYKYRYITEKANEIIALHNTEGYVTYISPAVKTTLGFAPEEMLGRGYHKLIGPSFAGGEVSCFSKDGREVFLEISFKKVKDELGSGDVYLSMARDISEKVNASRKIDFLRKQMAGDFHDELGNKLASITLNSSILALKTKSVKEERELIQKIENTSKSLYLHSRDFIWSIDAKSDELREIFSYLRDFGDDFFQSTNVDFIVAGKNFSEQEKVILPMYSGRHIIMIFKEVLSLLSKDAACKKVLLSLEFSKREFSIAAESEVLPAISPHLTDRAKSIDCELRTIELKPGLYKISLVGKLPFMGGVRNGIQM